MSLYKISTKNELISSFMCKETSVLIIFYLSTIFVLLDLKKMRALNKTFILYLTSLLIIFSFIALRFILFGNLTSPGTYLKSLSYYVYMYIYGLASFILPFDIVEYYSSYFDNITLFFLISFLLITILILVLVLMFSFNKRLCLKILSISIISFLSMFIYIVKYPLSRLAYNHIILFLLLLLLLFNVKKKYSAHLIKGMKTALFALTIIGLSILINQKLKIDEYNNNVISVINNNLNNKDIISLASIIRVGQNWCLPPYSEIEKYNNSNKRNITSAFGIHMTTKDNIFNTVKYFRYGDTAIIVNSISNTILLSPVREPFYFFSEESVKINDEIEIKINKMSNSRPKYASSIIISFSSKIIKESDVIYFGNRELCNGPFDLFINNLKYYSENNN